MVIRRILINERGVAHVFYVSDDGRPGSERIDLRDTAEMSALAELVKDRVTTSIAARAAERAEAAALADEPADKRAARALAARPPARR